MRVIMTAALAAGLAATAGAQTARDLGAHEHGVGALRMAIEGDRVAMEFEAPGADLVGFEHAAETAEDRAAVEGAIAALGRPAALFAFPDAAGCSVVEARASLEGAGGAHGAHAAHGGHAEHSDHAEHGRHRHDGEHAHDGEHGHGGEHAEAHGEHGHHDHDRHAGGAGHAEFHAEYAFVCDDPEALRSVAFPYFERFPNARALEVQVVSASGARAYEATRAAPTLDLAGGM